MVAINEGLNEREIRCANALVVKEILLHKSCRRGEAIRRNKCRVCASDKGSLSNLENLYKRVTKMKRVTVRIPKSLSPSKDTNLERLKV